MSTNPVDQLDRQTGPRTQRRIVRLQRRHEETIADVEVIEAKIAALRSLKESEDPNGHRIKMFEGCMAWRRRQLQQWRIPGGGWRSVVFFPIRFIASLIALPVQLGRWKDLHAEDGYAEPPRSAWRIAELFLHAPSPWTRRRLPVFLLFAVFVLSTVLVVVITSLDPSGALAGGPHASNAAVVAAVWIIVLSLTGDLSASWRGPVRVAIWFAEMVFFVAFASLATSKNLSPAGAIGAGLWLAAYLDLLCLMIIVPLVYVRDAPIRSGQARIIPSGTSIGATLDNQPIVSTPQPPFAATTVAGPVPEST